MDTNGNTCPICFEDLSDKPVGAPDVCGHKFCLSCLETWTKHGNFCPVDRKKFKNIVCGNEVIQIKYKRKKRGETLYDISVHCELCKDEQDSNDTVLLCDSCDLGFHLDCLNPPLKSIPSGNWYCKDCQEVGKKSKFQKTKHEGKKLSRKASTNSKRSSSLSHNQTLPTEEMAVTEASSKRDKNAKLNFTETNCNSIKQPVHSINYYQKNLPRTMTANSSSNGTQTQQGEFEDFFRFSDNTCILTKREPVNVFSGSIEKESGTSSTADLLPFGHIWRTCDSLKTQQTGSRRKRFAAAVAGYKINRHLTNKKAESSADISASSSAQYSIPAKDSLENTSSRSVNHFADINKSELYNPSCTFSFKNKNTMNEIGISKSSDMYKNVTTFTNAKSSDLVTEDASGISLLSISQKNSCKASPTSTLTNNFDAERLNNFPMNSFTNNSYVTNTNKISPLKQKLVREMDLENIEGKNAQMENLDKSAVTPALSGICENVTTLANTKSSDLATEDANRIGRLSLLEKIGCKASPTSGPIKNSKAEKLNNFELRSALKYFNSNYNVTSNTNRVPLSKPKSVNETDLEDIEGRNNIMENLNESAAPKSSVCGNLTTLTNLSDTITENWNRTGLLTLPEKTSCKASSTSSQMNNSVTEKFNAPSHLMSEYFNNNNATNSTNKLPSLKPKFTNEMGVEGFKEKNSVFENLNKNAAPMCENLTMFTNGKSSVANDLIRNGFLNAPETVGCKAPLTSNKINNSKTEKVNITVIHTTSKSYSVSEGPDIFSTNCNSVNKKLSRIRTRRASPRTHFGVDFQTLRNVPSLLSEARTKRLAAENARKKLSESFKSSSDEFSSDESSDSLDEDNVNKKDFVEKPLETSSNHSLFVDIEKVLSHRNSPVQSKNNGYLSSESEMVSSDTESSNSIGEKNSVMEDLNRSAVSKSSESTKEDSILKVSHYVEKPDCKASATKSKSYFAKDLRNVHSHQASESFSESEKLSIIEPPEHAVKSINSLENPISERLPGLLLPPPELTLEPINSLEKPISERLPELLLEPLNATKSRGNKMSPIVKERKSEQTFISDELEKGSFSSPFSVFEKINDTSSPAIKQLNKNRTINGETLNPMENFQNVINLENDELSEDDNSSVMEVDGDKNILDGFHIRQVRYAIKAKMSLPSELQKMERETWLSRRSKSSGRYKYKSSSKEAEIHISSSSHHQIVSGNDQMYNFFQSAHLDRNNSTYSEQDLSEGNRFNPFCESASGSRPKKLFQVSEYKLELSDKRNCFNNVPNNVLRNIAGPYGLKHLDIREDGSLFLNWSKSISR